MKLNHIEINSSDVDVSTWGKLIRSANITSINYLKIDTPDHDFLVIKSILDSETNILPKKIKFEIDTLTSSELIDEILFSVKERGYEILEKTECDITVSLSKNKIEKIIFASDSKPEYLDFWEINSKLCSKKLRTTPVLFHICDEETDFYWDEYGLVKKVKTISGDNTGFESQIYRMYGTKFFMDEICLTNDIDMLILNKEVISNELIDKESITILGADAYDSKRPECVDKFAGPDRYPICYIAATGESFNKVLSTNVSFEEYYERLLSLGLGFDTDEIYFGRMVNQSTIKVNKVDRGYCSEFFIQNRIERHHFYESGTHKLNLNGYVSVRNFMDCHSARPYSEYKNQIDNLVNIILSDI